MLAFPVCAQGDLRHRKFSMFVFFFIPSTIIAGWRLKQDLADSHP